MKLTPTKLLAAGVLGIAGGFVLSQTSQPSSAPGVQPAVVKDGVHSITMIDVPPPILPDGPGKDVYMVACALCHTQRYVTMQPRFSRKAWTDEVNKMITTYKAQIPPDQVPTIVDYLTSIRGNGS
jgi:cytochrome c5